MKKEIDSAMDKCEQLAELIRIIKEGGENSPRLLYDLAAEKCNEISLLLTGRNTRYFDKNGDETGQDEVNAADKYTETDTLLYTAVAETEIEIASLATEETKESASTETSEASPCNADCREGNSNTGDIDAADIEAEDTTDEVKLNGSEAEDTTDEVKEYGEHENGVSGSPEGSEVPNKAEADTTEDEDEISDAPDSESKNDTKAAGSEINAGTEPENESKETPVPNTEAATPSHGICFERRCKIKGIREVLSINDLYLFKRELFNNDLKEMNSLFDKLEKAVTLDECEKILNDYINFEPDDESPAAEFFERLKNRF